MYQINIFKEGTVKLLYVRTTKRPGYGLKRQEIFIIFHFPVIFFSGAFLKWTGSPKQFEISM